MKKILTLLTALLLSSAMMADEVSYVDASGTSHTVDATPVTSSTTTLSSGWYVVNSDVSTSNNLTCSGDVNLILADGCTLTSSGRIIVSSGNSFTVYAQEAGTGTLTVIPSSSSSYVAAIGSSGYSQSAGTMTFNGGIVNATVKGNYNAAIGVPTDLYNTGLTATIIINGGQVNATNTSGIYGACIGSASATCTIQINGGLVNTTSTNERTASIGSYSSSSTVSIGGNAIVTSSGYNETYNQTTETDTQCIRWNGTTGTVYGNVLLTEDYTLPEGGTLTIPEGSTFTVCGATLTIPDGAQVVQTVDGSLVTHAEHPWDEGKVIASTSGQDCMLYTCSCCGMTKIENGHNFSIESAVVAPTCTEKGYTIFQCSICSETVDSLFTDPLGHDFSVESAVVAPTCTEKGYTTFQCSICSETVDSLFTDPLGHDFSVESAVVAPTCTEKGYTTFQCSRCSETVDSLFTDSLGHDFSVYSSIAPTCMNAGQVVYQCSRCDTTNTVTSAPLAHNYVNGICTQQEGEQTFQAPEQDADGQYLIGNAGNLMAFAQMVNAGATSINALITADIDLDGVTYTPMGSSDNRYSGTIVGQNHTIKNMNITATEPYTASLITYSAGAAIEFLTVQGTINTSAKYASAFIGNNNTSAAHLYNCISDVDIISTVSGDGTHAGLVAVADAMVVLYDCAFIGSIKSTTGTNNCACLIGWDSNSSCRVTNCYTIAELSSGICQEVLVRNGGSVIRNSYFLYSNGTGQGEQVTSEQVANGDLCYKLNGGVTNGTQAWYQAIGTDPYPILIPAEGNTVYGGYADCTGVTYRNDATGLQSERPAHTTPETYDADGFAKCRVCGILQLQPATLNADNVYEIGNPGQLCWFSNTVTDAPDETYHAVLTQDILMDTVTVFHPMCYATSLVYLSYKSSTISQPGFQGTFDGQGHTISNLTIPAVNGQYSAGLFGNNSGTIQNLGLINVKYDNGDAFDGRFAALAGVNFGTIQDCYVLNSRIVSSSHICGVITGANYGGTIQDCYVLGNTLGTNSRSGHMVGDANNDGITLSGQIINCYSDDKLGNEGQSDYPGGGQTGETNVTASRFASGEICYLLNGTATTDVAWRQTLPDDTYPVPDATHAIVYPNNCVSFNNTGNMTPYHITNVATAIDDNNEDDEAWTKNRDEVTTSDSSFFATDIYSVPMGSSLSVATAKRSVTYTIAKPGYLKVYWMLNQNRTQYGHFKVNIYVNDNLQKTYDYSTSAAPSVYTLDAILGSQDASTIKVECEKTDAGSWMDEDGRTFSVYATADLHTNVEHIDSVGNTCTVSGTLEYWHCNDCGKNFSDSPCEQETSDVTNTSAVKHLDVAHFEAIQGTCINPGTMEHWHCNVCSKNFSDEACTHEITSTTEQYDQALATVTNVATAIHDDNDNDQSWNKSEGTVTTATDTLTTTDLYSVLTGSYTAGTTDRSITYTASAGTVKVYWRLGHYFINYGKFLVYIYVNDNLQKSYDYTSSVAPSVYTCDTLDLTESTNTIRVEIKKTNKGTWWDADGRTFSVCCIPVGLKHEFQPIHYAYNADGTTYEENFLCTHCHTLHSVNDIYADNFVTDTLRLVKPTVEFTDTLADGVSTALCPFGCGETIYGIQNAVGSKTLFVQRCDDDTYHAAGQLQLTDGDDLNLPVDVSVDTVTYARETSRTWGTLVLPFDVQSNDQVQYYTVNTVSGSVITLRPTTYVDAGTPVIFQKMQGTGISMQQTDVELPATGDEDVEQATNATGWDIHGTYKTLTLDPETTLGNIYYINNNRFVYGNLAFKVAAYRAWLQSTSSEDCPAYTLAVENADGTTTAILGIDADGQPYEIYSLDGKKLNTPIQGAVNIINGRKVLIPRK